MSVFCDPEIDVDYVRSYPFDCLHVKNPNVLALHTNWVSGRIIKFLLLLLDLNNWF